MIIQSFSRTLAAMNRFHLYVFRQLLVAMAFSVTILTCVIWLTQSLRVVELIVNRGLSISSFLYLTALALPNFLEYILLISLFGSVLFVYARLVTDRELVVMRAAGLGQVAIARPALIMAFVVMAICYVLGLYVVPTSYHKFRNLQWEIRYNVSHILLREGAFNGLSANMTVYVRERTGTGELEGILIHDTRQAGKPRTWMAERGAVVETDKGPQVLMFNGSRQEVDETYHRLSILHFDRWSMPLDTGKSDVGPRYREARERYVDELLSPDADPRVPERDFAKMIAEGHRRLTWPLFAIGFTLVALSALISGGFNRRGQGIRVLGAVAVMVTLVVLALAFQNLTGKKPALAPLLYINALLPIMVGGYQALSPSSGMRRRSRNWFHRAGAGA